MCAEGANKAHLDALDSMKKSLSHALEAGEWLVKAKDRYCQHGSWTAWLCANFKASEETARAYMRVWKNRKLLAGLSQCKSMTLAEALSFIRVKREKSVVIGAKAPEAPPLSTVVAAVRFHIQTYFSKDETAFLADHYLLLESECRQMQTRVSRIESVLRHIHNPRRLCEAIEDVAEKLTRRQKRQLAKELRDVEFAGMDRRLYITPLTRRKLSDPLEWLCPQDVIA